MRTIQEKWNSYRQKVMSPTAPKIQIDEVKMGFYGGASAVLGIMFNLAGDDVSEDSAARVLEGLNEEIQLFLEGKI